MRCEMQMMGYKVGIVFLLLISASVYNWRHDDGAIPDYVNRASGDLENFLSYTYGDGQCKAKNDSIVNWELKCRYDGNDFIYGVGASSNAPYKLTALNQNADRSSEEGLIRFLSIERLKKTQTH